MFHLLLHKSNVFFQYLRKYPVPLTSCKNSASPIFALNIFGFYKNSEPEDTTNRYWTIEKIPELLEEADRLYYEENYLEVYQTLNRLKYQDNVEVQWRICRVLFKLSCVGNKQKSVKENMIVEAYNLISKTLAINDHHFEAHKWMAVILDAKSSLEGAFSRIKTAPLIHEHMQKSLEVNPADPVTLYMLGVWCYEISKLNWIQQQIASRFFHFNPTKVTSTDEAYKYFLKAEQIKPRFFVGNIYMLGLCSYDLGMYFRARYYLKIAADLPIKSDLERKYSERAKSLADKLQKYEVKVQNLCH